MELGEVGFENGWGVARRIAADEEGEERRALGCRGGGRRCIGRGAGSGGDQVDHACHFIEFFRADVRTVSEAKVNLLDQSQTVGVISLHSTFGGVEQECARFPSRPSAQQAIV